MTETIIISLISFAGTAVGTLGGIVASQKLSNYRIERLEKEVRDHNNFARRMPVVEEQIKDIYRCIEDVKEATK